MLSVDLSVFLRNAFNMKKLSSFKEMKLKQHTNFARLLRIYMYHLKLAMFDSVMQQPLLY